jgi:hypothetical protein
MTEQWRHKKRGTVYEIVTQDASVQCSANPVFEAAFDGEAWTIYRNVKTGAFWVRPTEEFFDGRFERIESSERAVL